ncbi:hypothetical protein AVEN_84038-1 [Araneus ventricosus]|uniref:RNase H type-1 domain-containing protein n=1 Tax=Araneus ventricosus TaxID=182803 RepID=A0A4Y2KQD7_ARAVE|nr:hypothetical protein AVEN_84038-1 [Araneus ventricosus]
MMHLQWIPSHVDIYGNEVADNLAKQGTAEPLCSTPSLTSDEIYSIRKNKDLKTWRVPPSHDWYKRSSPGGSIGLACDRADQTALSRFVSGHLRSCSFSHGNKVFPVCAKCGVASASPEHILSCLRLSREAFVKDPLLALDFLGLASLINQLQNTNPKSNTEVLQWAAEADDSLTRKKILTDDEIIRTVTAADDDDVTPENSIIISHSEAGAALNTSLQWAEEQNFEAHGNYAPQTFKRPRI